MAVSFKNEETVLARAWIKRLLELSDDPHNVYTPFELCDGVLDKVPLEGKVLVVANLEFVYTIVQRVSSEDVYFATPCEKKARMATKWIPAKNIFVYNNVITKEDVGDMKFDVVCGNPPYQERDENGNHPLWPKFVEQSASILNPRGYLAFVTPRSWIGKQSNRSNNYDVFLTKQIKHLEVFDQASSPFNAGTTVCWFIIQNVGVETTTTVIQHERRQASNPLNIQLGGNSFLPGVITPITMSINSKIASGARMSFVKSYEFHNEKLKKKGLVSDTQDAVFKYPNYVSHRILRYTSVKFSNHETWKVMIPSTSTIDNCVVANECGHGEDMYSVYVSTEAEARRVVQLLNSKLFRYIGVMYRGGRNLISAFRSQVFPAVDLTRSWTDKELYAHFNLTEEEIKLIEDTIK